MADFAALRAADAARFARGERGHVVVQHEAVVRFFAETVDDLFVLLRAERRKHEGLRFAAGEEGGAMGTRKHALADFDRADRAGVAAVDAGFAVEDVGANELGFEFEEDAVDFVHVRSFGAGGFGVGDELGFAGGIDFAELFRTGLLGADAVGFLEAGVAEFDDAGDEGFVLRGGLPVPGRLAGFGDELVDGLDADLHGLVAGHHGFEHRLFRKDVGLGFNHEDGAFRTGDDEVEAGGLEFFRGRVDDDFVIDVADAAGADRAAERDAGDGEGGGGADHGRNVRINGGVGGEDVDDNLDFVEEAVREERADRTVDQAGGERFLFGRTAFALEEAAGDLAGSVGLFDVVDGEREEVLAGLRFLLGHDRGEHHRVVHLADAGAGGLTGDLTGGEGHVVIAEAEGLGHFVEHRHDVFLCAWLSSLTLLINFPGARAIRVRSSLARCGISSLSPFPLCRRGRELMSQRGSFAWKESVPSTNDVGFRCDDGLSSFGRPLSGRNVPSYLRRLRASIRAR